jgi:purine nucleoside phosphorylase
MDETSARARLHNWNAKVAIILGSGLGGIVQNPIESIAYAEFSEIPEPRVPGHAGKFSLSEISDVRVIFAQGRAHLYEGFSAHEVTAGVRLLAGAGISKLIVSNAAGAANDEFKPGDWMMIRDHLNLTGTSPLIGAPKFLDLTDAYSARWQKFLAMRRSISASSCVRGFTLGFLARNTKPPLRSACYENLAPTPSVCRQFSKLFRPARSEWRSRDFPA